MYQAMPTDTALIAADTLKGNAAEVVLPKLDKAKLKEVRDWSTWKPKPQRALWMALVIPGGGQIYNRKYWKLPLVYGGFVGCIYAMTWNNMMYKDYSQAYLDIMDDDPKTASYNKFLHLGRQITAENEERYKNIFKKRKDRYRRYRDMSFFVMIGVYALSVIDAYVDAELSDFDISKDLSLRVRKEHRGLHIAEQLQKPRCEGERDRQQLRRLIRGVAVHDPLVPGAALVHAHRDIG